jgi:hypothetical protein
MLILESGLTLIAVLIAVGWPRLGSRWFARTESILLRLSRRRRLSVLTVGCVALAIRLAILPAVPIPQPYIHDEFSFLLASDTFASGRLTNLTHPLWQHFESFHITQIPTYMSMYFPAQGLALAAGQILTGRPWYGVWFTSGLMCAAICWMLQGWMPPGWALFGGALAIVRLSLFSYWGSSYYGGAIAATGGALVLGALPRILRGAGGNARNGLAARSPFSAWFGAVSGGPRAYRIRDGVLMATGAAILANSRPVEGLLVCAPAVSVALWAIVAQPKPVRKLIGPATLLIAAAGLMGYYNYRVFGNPWTLPYQVNRAEYASAPVFMWQSPRPVPLYRHAVMRDFYTRWELGDYQKAHTLSGFVDLTIKKAGIGLLFVLGILFLPVLVALPGIFRDRRMRYLTLAGAIFSLGLASNVWMLPHYLAPFIAGFYAILVHGMRRLRGWGHSGRALVRLIPIVCVILAGLRLAAGPIHMPIPRWPTMWYGTEPLGLPRAAVAAQLASYAGKQLVIVRYAPSHAPFDDWVYNAADIDRSRVVWAREMKEEDNLKLIRYFGDREVWLAEPDTVPPRVTPWGAR